MDEQYQFLITEIQRRRRLAALACILLVNEMHKKTVDEKEYGCETGCREGPKEEEF